MQIKKEGSRKMSVIKSYKCDACGRIFSETPKSIDRTIRLPHGLSCKTINLDSIVQESMKIKGVRKRREWISEQRGFVEEKMQLDFCDTNCFCLFIKNKMISDSSSNAAVLVKTKANLIELDEDVVEAVPVTTRKKR